MIEEEIKTFGEIEVLIDYKSGQRETILFPNTILRKGRQALAKCLTNQVGDSFDFFISRMIHGDGGTVDGVKREVNSERTGLFGVTRASKPVISVLNPSNNNQAIFTSVLTFDDANGYVLNELALQLNNSELYSMATYGGLTKTDEMQLTYNWRLSFV